ncbi:hypothetical protein [Saccharicrinis sp. 156]|uniref:hypothetical protein n=1 Tax=Saccharicrinis sp. 156 TaxID=3417574 RepID=UPI003D328086
MNTYYQSDTRWELYNIKDKEDYCSKMLVKGRFHDQVPDDIKDAWKTVEYLLAHSFYHWQMYDEGFKKALLIIEMAVKLRAKELGMSLKTEPNKKGKVFDHKLVNIINKVFVGEHYLFLKNDIDRARKLRNHQVHSDSNTYMGGMGNIKSNLMLAVNVLNTIFQSNEHQIALYQKSIDIADSLRGFKNELLVLEYSKPSILIDQVLDFKLMNNKLYLFLNPLRNNIKEILAHHYSLYPETICLSEYEINSKEIRGISEEGCQVRIYKTSKAGNLSTHQAYLSHIENSDRSDWEICVLGLKQNTSWKIVELEYENMSKSA